MQHADGLPIHLIGFKSREKGTDEWAAVGTTPIIAGETVPTGATRLKKTILPTRDTEALSSQMSTKQPWALPLEKLRTK